MQPRANETNARAGEATDELEHQDALEAFDARQALDRVARFARENPHTALAAAAAVGFVLGGGLTPRIVGAAALFAGRRYLNQSVRETLDAALRSQLEHLGVRPSGEDRQSEAH